MPEISVIVPVYNVENYLDECIESILNQSFSDFELILVDDGSPDKCPEICDNWAKKDSRIKVIHKKNEGVSVARNAALDIASGKYITFCDSDDFFDNNRLFILFSSAREEKADLVVSKYTPYNDIRGDLINIELRHHIGITEYNTDCEIFDYIISIGKKHGWEVCTRLFKADIIKMNNIRFPTTCENYAEDLAFSLAYSLYANRIISLEYSGYYYRIRSGSMMRNSEAVVKLNQLNEVSAWFFEWYRSKFKTKEYQLRYSIIHFLIMHIEYMKLIGTDNYSYMQKYISDIQNQKWFKKQTRNIFKCKKELQLYYGKRVKQQILLFSHYCIHKNWFLFKIQSYIAYRWFIEGINSN